MATAESVAIFISEVIQKFKTPHNFFSANSTQAPHLLEKNSVNLMDKEHLNVA
jgi:hypothetical protein